jgi:hypothetical protein
VASRYGSSVLFDIAKLKLDSPQVQTSLWIIQFAGTTLPILITPIIFAYLVVRDPHDYMKHNFHFPWVLILLVLILSALAFPIIEYLGNVNAKMVLPKALKGLEDWMRQSETDAEKISNAMMQMGTFSSMLFDLLFIGLLTAVIEEILFRGCLQTILLKWTGNIHAAIWITAILFSAFHMEFYGFLPRMFLGLLFGYFVAWSGSIWPAILAHFINNGTVVVATYLAEHKMISIDPNATNLFNNVIYIISIVLTLVLLFVYKYISDKWHLAHHGEELD